MKTLTEAEQEFKLSCCKNLHQVFNIYEEVTRRMNKQRPQDKTLLSLLEIRNLQTDCSEFLTKNFGTAAMQGGNFEIPWNTMGNDVEYGLQLAREGIWCTLSLAMGYENWCRYPGREEHTKEWIPKLETMVAQAYKMHAKSRYAIKHAAVPASKLGIAPFRGI